jgi:tetratricopeptide (TPR) repeat protein
MINQENGFDLNVRWSFPDFRKHAFAFIALFVLLLIIYGNSLNGAWQFDDFGNIVDNPSIHLKSLTWTEIKNAFFSTPQYILGRSVAEFSFALNYYAGGLNVFGYHLVNIVIHLIASIFLYLLVYNTLNLPLLREKYRKSSYAIALLAAFLWASSPVHVNAVTYIVQRMASLAGMFYVMSMYFYLKGRTTQDIFRRIFFFLLCVVAGFMAFASKENAFMLPIAIFLYDLFLIQGVSAESIRKNRPIILLVVVTAIAALVYVIFFTSILDYQYWTFTMKERLLTAPRILLFYISLLLYPLSSRLTLDHDIQISRSLLDPWSTLPAMLLIGCAIVYALWIARQKPLISFCIVFFFLNHLIEGTIIPLDLIFEHRNYLPSMFFFVPVAVLMISVLDYFAYKRALQLLMFLVMTFLLTAQGHTVSERNDLYRYPATLWMDSVEKSPNLSRPRGVLGNIYAMQGDYLKAIKATEMALQLSRYPDLEQPVLYHSNLGSYYFIFESEKNEEKALFHYQEALRISERIASPLVYPNMAYIMLYRGDLKLAHEYGEKAIVYAPKKEVSHNIFARVLFREGNLEEAVKEAARAIALRPDSIFPLAILGEANRLKGNYGKAAYHWEKILKIKQNDIIALFALLELYHLIGEKDKSLQTAGQLLYLSRNGDILGMIRSIKGKDSIYTPDPKKFRLILQKEFRQLVANVPQVHVP